MFDIREELKKLPAKPGVYLMYDATDEVIYVGKAKHLRNRVRSYFRSSPGGAKVAAMVEHIARFEYIIVDSEVESLVLESNLIKAHRPKYNILLRDDKQYPYIKLTDEPYPRLIKTRLLEQDGGKYFGPFPNALAVNICLGRWHALYRLRTCRRNLDVPSEPCLNYHIDRCDAPCARKIGQEEYARRLEEPVAFLSGHSAAVLATMEEEMHRRAENMEYEQAAEWREAIEMARLLAEEQKITRPQGDSADYIAFARAEGLFLAVVFFRREGKMIGKTSFALEDEDEPSDVLMAECIRQHYLGVAHPPRELVLEIEPAEGDLLREALLVAGKTPIRITVPTRGEKRNTIMMVKKNAMDALEKHRARILQRTRVDEEALGEMARIMGTGVYPYRIESFDISHIQGADAVGAMVVFREGHPERNDYRRFKIRDAKPNDDAGCMREILLRRYKRLVEGEKGFSVVPDVLLMDGGKAQVHVAESVLEDLGLDIPVMGMVKDHTHTTCGLLYRDVFYPFEEAGALFRFVSTVQNEVHRFAISYHRSLRGKTLIKSQLDGIRGIGPKRKKLLMETFGSLDKIRAASVEDLAALPGMTREAAVSLHESMATYEVSHNPHEICGKLDTK